MTLAPSTVANVATVYTLTERLQGKIFGATFEKKDGTIRTGSFRLHVAKNVTGAGRNYDADAAGNLIVWDMNRNGYRTIPLDRLISLAVDGETITL